MTWGAGVGACRQSAGESARGQAQAFGVAHALFGGDAFSGSNNLDLALASGKNDNPGSTGTASISTSPNNWLVFMQNGQEVVIDSGKSVSLTLTMAPAFKDEGELTDMTDITGNLTVLVEAK